MDRKRLEVARDFLQGLQMEMDKEPEKKLAFDMGIWGRPSAEAPCGFAGCVIGHLAKAGLMEGFSWVNGSVYCGEAIMGSHSFEQLADYFDLAVDKVVYLFNNIKYDLDKQILPRDVVEGIEEVLGA